MERLLTAKEVAALVGRSQKWVFKLASERKIPCVRLTTRGTLRFERAAIERWIQSHKIDAQDE